MDAFLLWHIRHTLHSDGSPTVHRDGHGDLIWDQDEGGDLKLLGVYSTQERADARIERARRSPGFRDEPDCFYVNRYVVDRDDWSDGFVTIP